MKTKNVVGHIIMQKEPVRSRFRRWAILPRFICLLLAVLFWLLIVDIGADHISRSLFTGSGYRETVVE